MNQTTQTTKLERIEAPHFVEIRSEPLRTAILCGGLPYHRRIGLRKLDTLLIVQGETAMRFRLGVGIDLPGSMTAALGFMAPKLMCYPSALPPAKHGWLFHLDHRNVIAGLWEPIWSEERVQGSGFGVQDSGFGVQDSTDSAEQQSPGAGLRPVIGFRVRLLETEGHNAQLGLRSFRPVASARQIEIGGRAPRELSIEGDKINIPVEPYRSIDVEVIFAR